VVVTGRKVKVTGPRGTLSRDFGHLSLELQHEKDAKKIKVGLWFGARKQIAAVRTVCTHIKNLFTGVLKVRAVPCRLA
jgi:large subunit ribosomal protein L9e